MDAVQESLAGGLRDGAVEGVGEAGAYRGHAHGDGILGLGEAGRDRGRDSGGGEFGDEGRGDPAADQGDEDGGAQGAADLEGGGLEAPATPASRTGAFPTMASEEAAMTMPMPRPSATKGGQSTA